MKTKLWTGLALALLLALLCCGAASANDSGTCGENLTWVFRSDTGELRIGGSGPMTEFGTYSAAPWYDYEPEIQYISINAGVTSIGRNAFYDCAGVESVTIPRSVESIGYLAFANCYSLTQVVILNPDAVIGDHDHDVFRSCPSGMILYGWKGSTAEAYADAESLNFTGWAPSGKCGDNASWSLSETADILTIRGTGATWDFTEGYPVFYNARIAVHSINIEEGITSLGDYLFCHMSHVESVTIPDSITHIGTGAFMGCTDLGPTVTIPYHVTSIGGKAFCNCSRLKDVNVLSLTASYGPDVFSGCAANLRIHSFYGSTAVDYASSSGFSFEIWPASGQCGDKANWSFDIAQQKLTVTGKGKTDDFGSGHNPGWYPFRSEIRSVVISRGVTQIGKYAFYGCTGLTSLKIADTVTQIGNYAFSANSLGSVTLPSSVTGIGEGAFSGSTNLKTVKVYHMKTTFGPDVFYSSASGLTIHGWPDSTAQTYASENGLKFKPLAAPDPDLFLPAGLTAINSEAFAGIKAKAPVIPEGVTTITGNPFAGSSVQVIYGYYASEADTFASSYGYYFIPIDDAWMAAH